MFFLGSNPKITSRYLKLIPDVEQLLKAKFVNFITMDVSSRDDSWSHHNKILHTEHAIAQAFLQSNFKNHVVNRVGVEKVK